MHEFNRPVTRRKPAVAFLVSAAEPAARWPEGCRETDGDPCGEPRVAPGQRRAGRSLPWRARARLSGTRRSGARITCTRITCTRITGLRLARSRYGGAIALTSRPASGASPAVRGSAPARIDRPGNRRGRYLLLPGPAH
ncbi:MAG TPA: hypothetical protein VNF47_00785 [Streptosporangiaceae bacterium]|nr:hypothetical protein [Streptosporangiaceae bacterium]